MVALDAKFALDIVNNSVAFPGMLNCVFGPEINIPGIRKWRLRIVGLHVMED